MSKYVSKDIAKAEQAAFMSKVYAWMTVALLLTGLVSYFVAGSDTLLQMIIGNKIMFYALFLGEILLVVYLSAAIRRISVGNAIAMFLLYAALNGATLSIIFLMYTAESIASTFFITAGTFGVMSAYGYFTKTDLTRLGNLAIMALIGFIIASVVNTLFFKNEMVYWIASFIGILIFIALVAYDTQKIKNIYEGTIGEGDEAVEIQQKVAILGALSLYLDFINLFLLLLRFFGNRRN